MAVETMFAPTSSEVANAKDTNVTGDVLKEFGKCAVALRKILHRDGALTKMEFLFIESHFRILQMAYFRWKRKHEI